MRSYGCLHGRRDTGLDDSARAQKTARTGPWRAGDSLSGRVRGFGSVGGVEGRETFIILFESLFLLLELSSLYM